MHVFWIRQEDVRSVHLTVGWNKFWNIFAAAFSQYFFKRDSGLKFRFSKKATKRCRNLQVDTYDILLVNIMLILTGRFCPIFVTFLENLNFSYFDDPKIVKISSKCRFIKIRFSNKATNIGKNLSVNLTITKGQLISEWLYLNQKTNENISVFLPDPLK